MGLDNGIIIKTGNDDLKKKLRKKLKTAYPWIEESSNLEAAYWRKCWNIRSLIIAKLKEEGRQIPANDAKIRLNAEDVDNIIAVLKSLTKNNWEEHGGSIWSYKDQKPYNKIYIKNLTRLKKLMTEHINDFEVYFYDSY